MAETEAGGVKEKADVKVILLGDSAVGKSKLVERFLLDDYQPIELSTYALTVYRHVAEVKGREVKVDLWDTAGQERFESMHPSYYNRASSCIMVFDCSRRDTYSHLHQWYKELRKYRKDIPVILVANKIDLDERVVKQTFKFATKRDLPLVFCSAATGDNVVKVFNDAFKAAVEYQERDTDDYTEDLYRTIDYLDNREEQDRREAQDALAAEEARLAREAASAEADPTESLQSRLNKLTYQAST